MSRWALGCKVGRHTLCAIINQHPPTLRPPPAPHPTSSTNQIFDPRDMAALPGTADVAPYAGMMGGLAMNNLSALLPTLVATRWVREGWVGLPG